MDLVRPVKLKRVRKLGSSTPIKCMLSCQREGNLLVRVMTEKILKEKEKLLKLLLDVVLSDHNPLHHPNVSEVCLAHLAWMLLQGA